MFTIKSKVTGREYAPNQCVFIKNATQAALYLKYATLLDLTVGQDNKVCFVFSRDETCELYRKWNAYELK